VSERYRDLLVDFAATGHDLGLHLHAFYDPDSPAFACTLDPATGALRSLPEQVWTPVERRRFWQRAYPEVGRFGAPHTLRGSLEVALARVEGLGRLGDPAFRVALFRAGSYDIGDTPAAIRKSLFAVRDAGIVADSDVTKGRLYHRLSRTAHYLCRADDPRRPAERLEDAAMLELAPEYNAEGDFLADSGVLERYLSGRLAWLAPGGRPRPGVHVITTITHTKFINFRRGLDPESLDPEHGDWPVVAAHLDAARARGIRVAPIREATDALADDLLAEPILVRGAEIVGIAAGPGGTCRLRFPLRVLGRGVPLGAGFALCASVRPPAWAAEEALSVEVWCGGRRIASRSGPGFGDLPVWIEAAGPWELRVRVPARLGIWIEDTTRGRIALRAALPFRLAHVEVGGRVVEGVRFERACDGQGVTATVEDVQ
jgi:hypothetical protein